MNTGEARSEAEPEGCIHNVYYVNIALRWPIAGLMPHVGYGWRMCFYNLSNCMSLSHIREAAVTHNVAEGLRLYQDGVMFAIRGKQRVKLE